MARFFFSIIFVTVGNGQRNRHPRNRTAKIQINSYTHNAQPYARITNSKISQDMENLAKNLGDLDF